jgi:hypothetical protein
MTSLDLVVEQEDKTQIMIGRTLKSPWDALMTLRVRERTSRVNKSSFKTWDISPHETMVGMTIRTRDPLLPKNRVDG